MTEKIQTRTFNYGNEKEAEWPPQFGTRKAGVGYWDKETNSYKEGYPPKAEKTYGQAPYIIQDTLKEAYRHPATGVTVESRKALEEMDKACGTITTDKKQAADPSKAREAEKARRKDHHDALHKAVAMLDAGTAPLNEETRQLCERQNEIVSQALNFDAFNVVGRKNNAKGKKYRRR